MKAETERRLNPRSRILVNAVKKLQEYDHVFGDPKKVAACAGELQRVLLKYASKSDRRVGPAEHSAIDQVLFHVARIACGPVVYTDSYLEGGLQFAIAGEAALESVGEAEPIDRHEKVDQVLEKAKEDMEQTFNEEQENA